ncbi:hypothetical protein DSO57_1006258 [Entomophthora muscae]|uniref:Uncharacterized protein n=1 Tax=Entomophthora muscae TaxID=34485 RepID=A0ACC2TW90_9FUNG|nr:hypothetical protein DSO57_1006258 [Entomophthora muscae]
MIPPSGVSFSLPLLDAALCEDDTGLALCNQMKQTPPNPPPSCITYLAEVFDPTRANRLPKHSHFDFSFCLTVDLVKINFPIYPLTLKEEALDLW